MAKLKFLQHFFQTSYDMQKTTCNLMSRDSNKLLDCEKQRNEIKRCRNFPIFLKMGQPWSLFLFILVLFKTHISQNKTSAVFELGSS